MAKAKLFDILIAKPSMILLITFLATSISPTNALNIRPRASDSCPDSHQQCGSSDLPSNFCCPASSTCISLDDDSSAICCPKGQSCAYIKPITCNVLLQDPSQFPNNPVMSKRLGDKLPKCGDGCCPFGYTCQDGTCALNNNTAVTATSALSSTSSTTSTATHDTTTTSTTLPTSTTTTPPSTTQTPQGLTTTPTPQPAQTETCSSFPSQAVVAGFFPGTLFGAALALLGLLCIRKRRTRNHPHHQSHKQPPRSSNGTVIGISSPIPSDESSYRTDFLLRPNTATNSPRRRTSDSARSVLHRTGSRVKGLFAATPRIGGVGSSNDSVPAVPPLPVTPPRQVIPHRQPSLESIRVYSPAGGLAGGRGRPTVRPVRYPAPVRGRTGARSETTFSEMIDRVGFQDGRGEPCYRVLETPRPGLGRSPFGGRGG